MLKSWLPLVLLTASSAYADIKQCDSYGTVIDYCACEPTKSGPYDSWTVFRHRRLVDGTVLKDKMSVQWDEIGCNQDLVGIPVCNHPALPPPPPPPVQ